MWRWVARAEELIAAEGAAVLVTITETKGSAPRRAGTRMLVSKTELWGTIGGGNLEYKVIEQSRRLLRKPGKSHVFQHYALGPLLEQCCGGQVTVLLERMDQTSGAFLGALAVTEATCVRTEFAAGGLYKTLVDPEEVPPGDWQVAFLAADGSLIPQPKEPAVMLERYTQSAVPLYMFGAGHVGRAVARALAPLAFDTLWVDSRRDAFPSVLPAGCRKRVTDDLLAVVQEAPANALFLIFTHSHQLDYELTAAVLARGDARYCGLIGSATKRARFENRMLRERVITEDDLPKLTCPIGVKGIAGKAPEVIAASVVAQLLLFA